MHTLSWLTPGKLINLSEPHFLFFLVIKKKKIKTRHFIWESTFHTIYQFTKVGYYLYKHEIQVLEGSLGPISKKAGSRLELGEIWDNILIPCLWGSVSSGQQMTFFFLTYKSHLQRWKNEQRAGEWGLSPVPQATASFLSGTMYLARITHSTESLIRISATSKSQGMGHLRDQGSMPFPVAKWVVFFSLSFLFFLF